MSILKWPKTSPTPSSYEFCAQFIEKKVPRVEVRVRQTNGTQILIQALTKPIEGPNKWDSPERALRGKHGAKNLRISMNGPAEFTHAQWDEFVKAVNEAVFYAVLDGPLEQEEE